MRDTVKVQIITDGDMSATIYSKVIDVRNLKTGSVQAVWTGNPIGRLTIESSNDGANFSEVQDSGESLSGITGNNFMYSISEIGYHYIRFVYSQASGSGTLNAFMVVKGN